MNPALAEVLIPVCLGGIIFLLLLIRLRKRSIRRKHFAASFPEKWRSILQKNVPIYNRLPSELQRQLEGHLNVFIGEKHFKGADDFIVTDEMRVTIAAHACLLLLNRRTNYFPRLDTIIIYPKVYESEDVWQDGPLIVEEISPKLGEASVNGVVIFSWKDVQREARAAKSGYNVALHEFAHHLDFEDGFADGMPLIQSITESRDWSQVFTEEYRKLREHVDARQKTLIDDYGASEPAEFFAVATETFFERGKKLRKQHPELYARLQNLYKVDPASWRPAE